MSGRAMRDLRARGVVVSHPLSMRGALGSNPSESTLACYTALWVHQDAIKEGETCGRDWGKEDTGVPDDVWEGQEVTGE